MSSAQSSVSAVTVHILEQKKYLILCVIIPRVEKLDEKKRGTFG
jgi:hypothetical protein